MHVKTYQDVGFLIVLNISLIIIACIYEYKSTSCMYLAFIASVSVLCIIIFIYQPFLAFDVDENGIQVRQLKRKVYFLDWSKVKTICIFPVTNGEVLYVSTLTRSDVAELIGQYRTNAIIYKINRFHSMNSVIWRNNAAKRIEGRPMLRIWGYESKKKSDQFAKDLLEFNYQYVKKHGGESASIFKFPTKIKI